MNGPDPGALVTTLIIHYRTPDLLQVAVDSFRAAYPQVPVLIVDNGSVPAGEGPGRPGSAASAASLTQGAQDPTTALLERLERDTPAPLLRIHREPRNIYHGPALDMALRGWIQTPYTFILDSDTETRRPGFLEEMIARLQEDPSHYAIGRPEAVNDRGFKDPAGQPILLTPYLLIKTGMYPNFPPFQHHGQPTLRHFRAAVGAGHRLLEYPIETYIDHLWRGTASRFGYGLGWRGKLDYLLNKFGL